MPLELTADGPEFSASIDSHFHVVSPANWQSSLQAINGVIDAPIDGDLAEKLLDEAGLSKAVVISSAYMIPEMYLSFGALEAHGGVPFYEDMGRNFNSLVSTLTQGKNSQLEFASKIYPDHTHTTILAPALNDALLYLYGPHLPRD